MQPPPTPFAPIDEIIAEMRAGRPVVLVDDEDRENEGDIDRRGRKMHGRR